jgi:hypothetical protein
MTRVVAILVACLLTQPTFAEGTDLVATQDGWDRRELETLLLELTDLAPGDLKTPEQLLESKDHHLISDQRRNLSPDDKIVFLSAESLGLTIATAGPTDRIHTIRIYFPVVNIRSSVLESHTRPFAAALFEALFPLWVEGRTWFSESLAESWERMAKSWEDNAAPTQDLVVTHQEGHVNLSTIGVPPDIQIYIITVRPECQIDVMQEDVFQRWVC